MKWNRTTITVVIILLTLLMTVPFLGMSHLFDWDEVNFAEAAREMLVTGEFSYVQINFQPFWEKPPLFIWLQALSMSLFGVNEFAARLPNAICGVITLIALFRIGTSLISQQFGVLWVLVFASSMLPQFYFRTGIIDPWFNLFIFLGVHQLIRATGQRFLNRWRLLTSALLISLAVLTKGPTALGIVVICCGIYYLRFRDRHEWKLADPLLYSSVVLTLGFSWFIMEMLRGHGYVIQEFIDYHIRLLAKGEAGHAQPFYYHAVVLLVGCFPMSLFFIFRWFQKTELPEKVRHYTVWMNILFWVVFIVFSIVKTKIVHYSSLTYFPMSFLAALSVQGLIKGEWKFSPVHQIVVLLFIAILGSAFVLLGMLDTFKEPLLMLLERDPLAYGNFSQHVPDRWFEPFIGLAFMLFGMASVVLIIMGKARTGVYGLFGTTLVTVWLLSVLIGPKMDHYLQSSLFGYYRATGPEHYICPIGFRSYAHLFYGERVPIEPVPEDEVEWMLHGKVDRPVIFVSRAQDLERNLSYFPHLKEIDRKGGYIILSRTDSVYPFLGER